VAALLRSPVGFAAWDRFGHVPIYTITGQFLAQAGMAGIGTVGHAGAGLDAGVWAQILTPGASMSTNSGFTHAPEPGSALLSGTAGAVLAALSAARRRRAPMA